MSRAKEILREGSWLNETEFEVRSLTFNNFPKDDAIHVAKYVLLSVADDLDEIKDWLVERKCKMSMVASECYTTFYLIIYLYTKDQAFEFKMNFL